jgi:CRISPR-associated protein Csb2
MMTTISIKLLSDIYCAAPWGSANCEGKVEWPPSPWRLLRSILCGGFGAQLSPEKMILLKQVVAKLGSASPSYHLPDATQRMLNSARPTPVSQQGRYHRKDGIAVLHGKPKDLRDVQYCFAEGSAIWVQFSGVELERGEERVLAKAISHCRYIGRAEAQAEWAIEDDEDMPEPNAIPATKGLTKASCWDGSQVEDLLFDPRSQQGAKVIAKVPPGLIWQGYEVSAKVNAPQSPARQSQADPQLMRFLLAPGNPIHRHNFLSYAQRLHQSLAKSEFPVLSGRQQGGEPIRGSWHSYLIPIFDRDYLVGFDVFAAAGFNQDAQLHAITIRQLWNRDGTVPCSLVQVLAIPAIHRGQIWRNITPVIPGIPRKNHRGRVRRLRGCGDFIQGGPEHQALWSLTRLPGFSQLDHAPVEYRAPDGQLQAWLGDDLIATVTRCTPRPEYLSQWQVERPNRPQCATTPHDIELTFPQEQTCHIALGKNAHYGMGLMRPVASGG